MVEGDDHVAATAPGDTCGASAEAMPVPVAPLALSVHVSPPPDGAGQVTPPLDAVDQIMSLLLSVVMLFVDIVVVHEAFAALEPSTPKVVEVMLPLYSSQ